MTDARAAQANDLKQPSNAIREEADGRADKLEADAKQIRADVYDHRAKADLQ